MYTLQEIKAPIADDLRIFDKKFRDSFHTSVPLLDRITRYIVKRKGKQMRPILVMLSAKTIGDITESTYHAASFIELLHTASLVHDDVVDDSYERRGFFSINALWKNKIAVLVGDFLLARGLLLSVDNGEYELLRIVSDATREMSEGELLQIEKARGLNLDEEIYFEIIRKKTASLIAACCASGAKSAGANKETTGLFHLFGTYLGIAFQIKDDLFDYEKSNLTGKPNGIDLKEKKLTLPVIHMLNNLPAAERRKYMGIIRNHHDKHDKVNSLIEAVNQSGGIEYARKKMDEYKDKALDILAGFPESEARTALEKLVIYTTLRNQ
jgi:octaprenyl-diphosphate synthase